MRIRPENQRSPLAALLRVQADQITVVFPERHERFVAVVRRLGYVWSGTRRQWLRRISPAFHGSVDDRAAELGHALLLAGFVVDFPGEALAQRAAAGDYTPEQRRWIKRRVAEPYKDWFSIEWPRDADLYHQARRLPGSRYYKPHVVVPPDAFAELQDFAEKYGFSLSEGAQRLISKAQERYEAAVLVLPAPRPQPQRADGQADPDGSIAVDIDPELRDDLADDH